jgi:hypothetical protein
LALHQELEFSRQWAGWLVGFKEKKKGNKKRKRE